MSAVFGQVDRNWEYSVVWGAVPQIQTFEKAVAAVLSGKPVGLAHRYFAGRYAELASQAPRHSNVGRGATQDSNRKRKRIEIAALDARNFILLGDPAARIPVDPI